MDHLFDLKNLIARGRVRSIPLFGAVVLGMGLPGCAPATGKEEIRAVSLPAVVQASDSPKVTVRADSAMTAPLEATFTAGPLAGGSAEWRFADGSTASGASVVHIFYKPGRYEVQTRMRVGGHEYLSTLPMEVRSSGPQQAAAVLLQDSGTLALGSQGSVVYAPYTPRYTLDGAPAGAARQALKAGPHQVEVSISTPAGVLGRRYHFQSRPPLTPPELVRQQEYEAEVLRLTNQARADGWNCQRQANGGTALPPLRTDARLQVAARAQSVGMALNGYFDHQSAVDGSRPDARIRAAGYRPTGDAENIAAGQHTPAEVVTAWLKSPGHCPHIMGDYRDIGVAYMHQDGSPYGDYWTQVFGTP